MSGAKAEKHVRIRRLDSGTRVIDFGEQSVWKPLGSPDVGLSHADSAD